MRASKNHFHWIFNLFRFNSPRLAAGSFIKSRAAGGDFKQPLNATPTRKAVLGAPAVLSAFFTLQAFAAPPVPVSNEAALNGSNDPAPLTRCEDSPDCSSICRSIYRPVSQDKCLSLSVREAEALAAVDEILKNPETSALAGLNAKDFALYMNIDFTPFRKRAGVFRRREAVRFFSFLAGNDEARKAYRNIVYSPINNNRGFDYQDNWTTPVFSFSLFEDLPSVYDLRIFDADGKKKKFLDAAFGQRNEKLEDADSQDYSLAAFAHDIFKHELDRDSGENCVFSDKAESDFCIFKKRYCRLGWGRREWQRAGDWFDPYRETAGNVLSHYTAASIEDMEENQRTWVKVWWNNDLMDIDDLDNTADVRDLCFLAFTAE